MQADASESIVTSIRSMHGRLLSGSDVRPDSIITLREGFETSVAAALAAGFITKDGQGYREVGHTPKAQGAQGQPKPTPAPQQAPVAAPAATIEALDPEALSPRDALEMIYRLKSLWIVSKSQTPVS